MIAVGWVVLNRIADFERPHRVAGVIQETTAKGCKFGCLCDGRSGRQKEAEMWALARDVTELMAGPGSPDDPTGGALWFLRTSRERPAWMGDHVQRMATLGGHHFYARNREPPEKGCTL